MTFITEKELQATRKFELVRIMPSRYLNDDLISVGSGKYEYYTTYPIVAVYELGTALTKVTTVTNPGEYSFNESIGLLTIYPSAVPSNSNPIVMDYYLFLTGEVYRTWYQDPENTSTTLRDWQPLLEKSPTVTQSIEDLLAGILSISSSSISVLNNNFELNEYFTKNDSFYNKEVKIWLCLEDETNIQKIFEGRVVRVDLDKERAVLSIRDNLSLLDSPALLNDNISETYFRLEDYPNLDTNKNGNCRPFITGTCSRYQTLKEIVTNLPEAQCLDQNTLYQAVCLNVDKDISNTVNRDWGFCRTDSTGFQDISFTAISVDNSDPNFTKLGCNPTDTAKIYIGDTFVINQTIDYYARVLYVDRINNFIYINPIAITGTPYIQSNDCPSVVIYKNSIVYYCFYGRDYIANVTTTTGSNKLLDIEFTTTLEGNLGITALDPTIDAIYYRVRPTILKHGDFVKKIIESSGLICNNASITAANSLLPVNVSFSIPKFDEGDYGNYYNYLQEVLSSTFGYVYLNNSFEIEYKLFQNPTSTNQITDTEILLDSFGINIEYQDIISQIIAYNPHANSEDFVSKTGTSLRSIKTEYLHGIVKTTRFQHCLEDITSRLSDILNFRSSQLVTYQMETGTKNLDSEIGEDFNLVKSGLLGENSKQVKLISIEKGSDKSTIILTDLGV